MNKFNRILLASGLAATASLVANSPAFAGTTATVNLSGTVSSNLTITVTPNPSAASLVLSPGSYSNVKVGTITGASTNSANGLKVVLSSSWALTSGANSIAITNIGDAPSTTATSVTGNQPFPVGNYTVMSTNTASSGSASDSSIFIAYTVPNGQAAGTYTGSITFTASDK
ncbi:hypothetical protein [Pseudanabaena yagii]|uniref:Uncharacterized protein n=1 Tax=Pseudanabaena yagii GIHE-NHR1 TaxID=2722753 RepID=A0ABX1LYH1_9CYAN|nr:hypothetical protein [Pseudanabaena yagii]NMF61234.1 hypothetical protein [Pseudanabaena yagii GIHE-NHR1]